MKRTLLIGDSIRLHYQPIVQQLLAPSCLVWGPSENCATSRTILQHLDQWIIRHEPPIIHLNCGLHDIRYNPHCDQPMVSLTEYAQNVERIFALLRTKLNSTIVIWATTTPINQERHQANRASRRYEIDVIEYNACARASAVRHDVLINDLYQTVLQHNRDVLLRNDGLHFTPAGYRLLAHQVAAMIHHTVAQGSNM